MLVAPIPLALASSANSRFQASKPAGPLPHWAAFALVPRHTSTAMIAKILAAKTVAAKVAVASSLLPIIPTLLRRGPEQVAEIGQAKDSRCRRLRRHDLFSYLLLSFAA